MAKVIDICNAMEKIAPPKLAESWDNTGLLVGDANAKVSRVMFCIDFTPAVLAETLDAKAQMVLAYHPVIFKEIKNITAQSQPAVFEAIRKNIAVYSPHTALDVAPGGVNDFLADVVGMDMSTAQPLENSILNDMCKLVVFTPAADRKKICNAAFKAGAGNIGEYSCCSFSTHGEGTFLPSENAHPAIGKPGSFEIVDELRIEMVIPKCKLAALCSAVRAVHRYEEPAMDIHPVISEPDRTGIGRIGRLAKPVTLATLVNRIKKRLGIKRILIAGETKRDKITAAAVGAGSCGSMWRNAAGKADVFLTGEMRHHDALAAVAAGLTVICVGHSNSERPALPIIAERLAVEVKNVKMLISQTDKDPFEIL